MEYYAATKIHSSTIQLSMWNGGQALLNKDHETVFLRQASIILDLLSMGAQAYLAQQDKIPGPKMKQPHPKHSTQRP